MDYFPVPETLPVYTIKNDCQDCYKCIRECKVKAIKVEDLSARIMYERCIFCGHCIDICPVNANNERSEREDIKELIKNHDVYVSLDPAYISEFHDYSKGQVINALKKLGFKGVSETAGGMEEIINHTKVFLENKENGIYISSACPSVNTMIKKYYPQFTDYLVPFFSPVLAHCSILKKELGSDIKTVFIGPCIAAKNESDRYPDVLDHSITFTELYEWFKEENIVLNEIDTNISEEFTLDNQGYGNCGAMEGGMVDNLKDFSTLSHVKFMAFSGTENIINAIDIKGLEKNIGKSVVFLELYACKGGCINGPGTVTNYSSAEKKYEILSKIEKKDSISYGIKYNISCNHEKEPVEPIEHTEEQIKFALTFIGMYKKSDEKNCGACGYNTCKEFAAAMLDEKAKPYMCISFTRKILDKYKHKDSQLKENLHFHQEIIDAISIPVFYRDREGKYIGCNKAYEELIGMKKKELIGKSVFDVQKDDVARVSYMMDQGLLKQPGAQSYEHSSVQGDGQLHHMVFNKATFVDSDGEVGGVVGVIFDITQRKKEKNELQIAKETAELSSSLLRKMPSGVVIVDDTLSIIDCNESFAKIAGDEAEMLYEVRPGLKDADLRGFIPFHKLFSSVLANGGNILDRDVTYKNGLLKVSLFTISQHKVVGGLILDMSDPEIRKAEVVERARKVIKENMQTVQQIAYLLGENASKTEAMLNSIIEFYSPGDKK